MSDGPLHVFPRGDLIEHDSESEDCVCGPWSVPVTNDDGSVSWLCVHAALDGRP